MSNISLTVQGTCVTRNGRTDVSSMTASHHADGTVSIGFVSSRLKRSLNAGGTIRLEDLDRFCQEWLHFRAYPLDVHADRLVYVRELAERLSSELAAL